MMTLEKIQFFTIDISLDNSRDKQKFEFVEPDNLIPLAATMFG